VFAQLVGTLVGAAHGRHGGWASTAHPLVPSPAKSHWWPAPAQASPRPSFLAQRPATRRAANHTCPSARLPSWPWPWRDPLPERPLSGETPPQPSCHTRVSGHQDPGANIITRCAGTKSHTYDESWHRIECHVFTI
jgi:hypothetical protein